MLDDGLERLRVAAREEGMRADWTRWPTACSAGSSDGTAGFDDDVALLAVERR